HPARVGPRLDAERRLDLANPGPPREPDRWVIVVLNLDVLESGVHRVVRIGQLRSEGVALTGVERVRRVQEIATQAQVLPSTERGRGESEIRTARLTIGDGSATRVPHRIERPYVGLTEHPPLDTADEEILSKNSTLFTGMDFQQTHVKIANLPEKLATKIDPLRVPVLVKADASGKEREDVGVVGALEISADVGAGEIEKERPIEKEIALLWKQQREAREIDLPLVDFRLGKVGVHRQIGSKARRDAIEHIEAGGRVVGDTRIPPPRKRFRCAEHVRLDVEAAPLADLVDGRPQGRG